MTADPLCRALLALAIASSAAAQTYFPVPPTPAGNPTTPAAAHGRQGGRREHPMQTSTNVKASADPYIDYAG